MWYFKLKKKEKMTTIQELQEIVKQNAIWIKDFKQEMIEYREENKKSREDFKNEMDEYNKKSKQEMDELRTSQKETSEQIQELKKSQEKTDEQINKMSEEVKKTSKAVKEMSKEVKETSIILRWMWITQWNISEDIFAENIENILSNNWKNITNIRKNVKVTWKVELDLVCVNGSEVFVVEVKTKLTVKHIEKFLETRLPRFRKYCTEYEKYKLYWIVAWRTITEGAEKYANKKWLYIIKENHDWRAKLLNNNKFKPLEYVF